MFATKKIIGVAALLTTVSGAAIAQQAVTTDVPESMETSRAVESGAVTSTKAYTEETAKPASSATTRATEAGATGATEVGSTIADNDIPESFETTDLAEAADLQDASDPAMIYFVKKNDTVISWEDEEAAEMRSAIIANTMVKEKLVAEGYSEGDVVSAYTRADGGLTLVVDG